MGFYRGPNIVTDGLVFAMDAGSERCYPGTGTVATDLVGSNTGTLTNGVGFSTNNGGYWEFDGADDYVNMNSQYVIGATQGTVSAWVNLAAANVNHAGVFCCQTGPSWANMRLVLNISSPNRIRLALSNGTNSTNEGCVAPTQLTYGVWYYVTATYDGVSAKIYINGVLDETLTTTITPGTFTPNATMIGSQNYSTRYFNGKIPFCRIYNKALTAAEVTQNFNAQKNRFI